MFRPTGSSSTNFCLLSQSFIGDGVTRNTFELDCFLAMGDNGASGVCSGSGGLMVENADIWNSSDVISFYHESRIFFVISMIMKTLVEVQLKN
jgi:hypothetical protein